MMQETVKYHKSSNRKYMGMQSGIDPFVIDRRVYAGYDFYIVDSLEQYPTIHHLSMAIAEIFGGWDAKKYFIDFDFNGLWVQPRNIPSERSYDSNEDAIYGEERVSNTPVIYIPKTSKAYTTVHRHFSEIIKKTERRKKENRAEQLMTAAVDNAVEIMDASKHIQRLQRCLARVRKLSPLSFAVWSKKRCLKTQIEFYQLVIDKLQNDNYKIDCELMRQSLISKSLF